MDYHWCNTVIIECVAQDLEITRPQAQAVLLCDDLGFITAESCQLFRPGTDNLRVSASGLLRVPAHNGFFEEVKNTKTSRQRGAPGKCYRIAPDFKAHLDRLVETGIARYRNIQRWALAHQLER